MKNNPRTQHFLWNLDLKGASKVNHWTAEHLVTMLASLKMSSADTSLLWSRALKGQGTLCCPAAPRMAALVKDNNTLTLLDLRLGYTLREPSAIVQRQILLCRGYASATQYLGELLCLAADLLFLLLMSTHCLCPSHGGVCFLPKTGLVLQKAKEATV